MSVPDLFSPLLALFVGIGMMFHGIAIMNRSLNDSWAKNLMLTAVFLFFAGMAAWGGARVLVVLSGTS